MTIAGAFFGISASNSSWKVAVVGLMPIVGFWLLDSYYLRQERLFRKLYDDVRNPTVPTDLFAMNVQPYLAVVPWKRVIWSHTMVNFYGILAIVNVLLITAIAIHVAR
ncbi:hypothetical protein ACIRL2_37545 [Embleya sp. NPDC127516]|uniref:hypothetical protein n=1 Tax=Embleya sp. NPDC127516 TaxID=3363990 RepID=UPI00382511CD